jgi:hypothetical protein
MARSFYQLTSKFEEIFGIDDLMKGERFFVINFNKDKFNHYYVLTNPNQEDKLRIFAMANDCVLTKTSEDKIKKSCNITEPCSFQGEENLSPWPGVELNLGL